MRLYEIQQTVAQRTEAIAAAYRAWPCHKGCDDCCRSLASPPLITEPEWREIERAISGSVEIRDRILGGPSRVCPMLDRDTGACMIYEARPIACRTYGFYAERDAVLGCYRVEALQESGDIIWGNHKGVQADLDALGPAKELAAWLKESRS